MAGPTYIWFDFHFMTEGLHIGYRNADNWEIAWTLLRRPTQQAVAVHMAGLMTQGIAPLIPPWMLERIWELPET